jgi:hypothetical protein
MTENFVIIGHQAPLSVSAGTIKLELTSMYIQKGNESVNSAEQRETIRHIIARRKNEVKPAKLCELSEMWSGDV